MFATALHLFSNFCARSKYNIFRSKSDAEITSPSPQMIVKPSIYKLLQTG